MCVGPARTGRARKRDRTTEYVCCVFVCARAGACEERQTAPPWRHQCPRSAPWRRSSPQSSEKPVQRERERVCEQAHTLCVSCPSWACTAPRRRRQLPQPSGGCGMRRTQSLSFLPGAGASNVRNRPLQQRHDKYARACVRMFVCATVRLCLCLHVCVCSSDCNLPFALCQEGARRRLPDPGQGQLIQVRGCAQQCKTK